MTRILGLALLAFMAALDHARRSRTTLGQVVRGTLEDALRAREGQRFSREQGESGEVCIDNLSNLIVAPELCGLGVPVGAGDLTPDLGPKSDDTVLSGGVP